VAANPNQSGVARQLFDLPTLEAIHEKMRRQVAEAGGEFSAIVYCPHGPDDGCDCRKPGIGLLLQLSRQLGVALDGVPMIGDSERDIDAARVAGGRPILVMTGNGTETAATLAEANQAVESFRDLEEAASFLIAESRELLA
jgi:D-glycero-D-manno-heptose 1,7-bisphosphate phosphatase